MKNWINVLAVDDDHRYIAIQAEKAAYFGINLIHFPYWDDAYASIVAHPHAYDAIVLDGKGQINARSESADINHLKKALRELNILEGKGIAIPYVVNTGYSEESAIGFEVKVFLKGTGEDDLYRHLQNLAANSLAYRMRSKFPDVFPLFEESLLGETAKSLFLEIYQAISEDIPPSQDIRNPIRKLIEAFCLGCSKIGILDPKIAGNLGRPNLTCCDYYIRGERGYFPSKDNAQAVFTADPNPFPQRIARCFTFLIASTNTGSHYIESDLCSHHLAQSLFYALVEILGWLYRFSQEFPDFVGNRKTIQVAAASGGR